MSLDDRIAPAREAAERSMDPADWAVVRALEGAQTAQRQKRYEPGDNYGIPPWSAVSTPESPEDATD